MWESYHIPPSTDYSPGRFALRVPHARDFSFIRLRARLGLTWPLSGPRRAVLVLGWSFYVWGRARTGAGAGRDPWPAGSRGAPAAPGRAPAGCPAGGAVFRETFPWHTGNGRVVHCRRTPPLRGVGGARLRRSETRARPGSPGRSSSQVCPPQLLGRGPRAGILSRCGSREREWVGRPPMGLATHRRIAGLNGPSKGGPASGP